MALLFALRGDSLTPRYAKGGKEYSTFLGGSTLAVPPVPVALSDPSCFGGYAIQSNTAAGDYREWYYSARGNWVRGTRTFSMLVRAATNYSGTPPNDINLMRVGEPRSNTVYGGARIWLQDNNTCLFMAQPKNGLSNHFLTAPSLSGNPLVAGVFKDYMLTANDATGKWYASIDGVQVATGDLAGDGNGAWDFDWITAPNIVFGTWPFNGWINEALIWDTCEPHVYSPRTAWLDCADFDGTAYDNVAANELKSGLTKRQAGVSVVGSVIAAEKATTKHGVAANDGTGEYRGADLNSALAADKILAGNSQLQDGVTVNGTAVRALAATTKIGVTADDGVGTYAATERYTDFGNANIRAGTAGKYNSTTNNRLGTMQTVTNVLDEAILEGQDVVEETLEEAD